MWTPIPDYDGYEANVFGQIRNSETLRIRNPSARNCNGVGYFVTPMRVNGRWISRQVHILIARTFLGPCPAAHEVNHKNGNKIDNRADNLEYVTHQQNMKHHFDNRTKPDPRERLTPAQFLEVRQLLITGRTQNSLALEYGVAQATISKIARDKCYKWIKNSDKNTD